MAYELTAECLVVEALLRDPSVNVNEYRVGLRNALKSDEATRKFTADYYKSSVGNIVVAAIEDGVVQNRALGYTMGYLAMTRVLAKSETLPEGMGDGV